MFIVSVNSLSLNYSFKSAKIVSSSFFALVDFFSSVFGHKKRWMRKEGVGKKDKTSAAQTERERREKERKRAAQPTKKYLLLVLLFVPLF